MSKSSFWFALVKSLMAVVVSATVSRAERPIIQGSGSERQMLVEVTVVGAEGQPADDYDLIAQIKRETGREVLATTRQGSKWNVWVPIGGSRWFYVELSARTKDGRLSIILLAFRVGEFSLFHLLA